MRKRNTELANRFMAFLRVVTVAALYIVALVPIAPTLLPAQEQGGIDVGRAPVRQIDAEESGLQYFRAVCGDAALMREPDMQNSDAEALPQCPGDPDANPPEGPYQLTGGYVGDFSGDGGREAILDVDNTAPGHPRWRPTTLVLKEADDGWRQSFFGDPGSGLGSCRPLQTPAQDWLLCDKFGGNQGVFQTATTVWAVEEGEPAAQELIAVEDTTAACLYDREYRSSVEKERIGDIDDDQAVEIVFGIERRSGEPVDGFDPDESPSERCNEENYETEVSREIAVWELSDGSLTEGDAAARNQLGDAEWERFDSTQ